MYKTPKRHHMIGCMTVFNNVLNRVIKKPTIFNDVDFMATLIDHKANWHLDCYKRVTNILFYIDIKTEKRHMIKVFQKKKPYV